MSKTYSVIDAQSRAMELRVEMAGRIYKHYKGDLYVVEDVMVDEETGEPRITYRSLNRTWRWSRTLANFTEEVNGVARFTPQTEKLP